MSEVSSVNVLDRTTFDNLDPQSKTGNIYFVREGSPNNTDMLSLYVGNSRQCDVLDISDIVDVDFSQVNYNIPTEYQVKNKLLFCEQQDNDGNSFYRTLMWNGNEFLDCFGTNNNVIVCNTLPSTGIYGYVYIEISTGNIYVYIGGFLKLVSEDTYATNQYVMSVYNSLMTIISTISTGGVPAGTVMPNIYGSAVGIGGETTIIDGGI